MASLSRIAGSEPRPGNARLRLRRSSGRRRSDRFQQLAMALPALLLYGALIVVPLLMAVATSFTSWAGFGTVPTYVGFDNYTEAASDPTVQRTLLVTAAIAFGSTIAMTAMGLLLASLLNHPGRLSVTYRAIIFFPIIVEPGRGRVPLPVTPGLSRRG